MREVKREWNRINPVDYRATYRQNHSSVVRNERLTGLVGGVLFVLIVIELVVTAKLHSLISLHIFLGVLLSGPLLLKLGSTGYKFFRFYSGSPVFTRKGPPHPLLRLLAPFLVLDTLAVFISGIGLAIHGPANDRLLFLAHAASVALWLPLVAVHVYAHIRKVPGLVARDLSARPKHQVAGRSARLYGNLAALIVGFIGALVMIPISAPWRSFILPNELPSPLVAGIAAAIFAVVVGVPVLRRLTNTGPLHK